MRHMGQTTSRKQNFFQNFTSMQKEPIRIFPTSEAEASFTEVGLSGHQMSMFDYLDTRALSEPTEIDMSDVEETDETVSESKEQDETLTDEDIVEVSEQTEVEQPQSEKDRKTAEQIADSWDEGVF